MKNFMEFHGKFHQLTERFSPGIPGQTNTDYMCTCDICGDHTCNQTILVFGDLYMNTYKQ
jgi:hypothetical protein